MGRRIKGSSLNEMARQAKEQHVSYGKLQQEETLKLLKEGVLGARKGKKK